MRIKITLLIITVLLFFSASCYAEQGSADSPKLIQELSIIRQELTQRGEISPQDNTASLQKISELMKELELAQNKIKQLETELRNKKPDPLQNGFIDISNKQKMTKDKQIIELTNEIETMRQNLLQCRRESMESNKTLNISDEYRVDDYRKQLDLSSNTIIEQTKQLSKAYEEIEKLKKESIYTDKIVDNLIYQAEKLHLQGKTQEAIAIYEILDKIDVRKPKIYQNLALIYQGLGMDSEADKQYDKLYMLFPSLKGDVKINKQKK